MAEGEGREPATAVPQRRFRWVRAASDRVPTRWFAGIGVALFLAATAAFGGLATAATPSPAAIEPGTAHRSDQVVITVQRAELRDAFRDAGITVDEGERVLAVYVRLENAWTQPETTYPSSTVTTSIGIAELPDKPESSARTDDGTRAPVLQPGVPADVVYTWAVDADTFAAGDELHVTLYDMQLYTASFVTSGQWWQDPEPAATLTLTLADAGAGDVE